MTCVDNLIQQVRKQVCATICFSNSQVLLFRMSSSLGREHARITTCAINQHDLRDFHGVPVKPNAADLATPDLSHMVSMHASVEHHGRINKKRSSWKPS